MNYKEVLISICEFAVIGFSVLLGLTLMLKNDEAYNESYIDSKFCALSISKNCYKRFMRILGLILFLFGLAFFYFMFFYTPDDELEPVKEFWKDVEKSTNADSLILGFAMFAIAIPARMSSTRFPGKPLAMLKGKTVIQRVYEKCLQSKYAGDNAYILTDSPQICEFAEKMGAKYVLTSPECKNGTERIVEALPKIDAEFFVNVQGDEPFIPVSLIDAIVEKRMQTNCELATAVVRIDDPQDLDNPNVVKALRNKDGKILYFSRSPLPYVRGVADKAKWLEKCAYFRHIGIYGYSRKSLLNYNSLPSSTLEKCEMLEQLRFVDSGYEFMAVESAYKSIGIDTPQDLAQAEKFLETPQQC